jgi:hypothetical protein
MNVDFYCCVCFANKRFLSTSGSSTPMSLGDVDLELFPGRVLPNDLLFQSSCKKHFICVECLGKIVHNYDNHPINNTNSHVYCPYPFEDCVTSIGSRNIFVHSAIQKLCKTDDEWTRYITHANQYAFPGQNMLKCPSTSCGCFILVDHQEIQNSQRGYLIIECTQNESCLKRFCYHCKQELSFIHDTCNDCVVLYENESPNSYNYYYNKSNDAELSHFEDEYLYLNKDLTVDIATSQIASVILDFNNHMICCICKMSVYKTEKCNGMSHHNLERCYACGRIGQKIRGLHEHWSATGVNGCFRFDTDSFVQQRVPLFMCCEDTCTNHDKGDCVTPHHQEGISKLAKTRKQACVYHMFKSLPPPLSLQVYDNVYNKYANVPTFIEYLPYKQTLILVHQFKMRYKDYTEEIVYEQLGCKFPQHTLEKNACKNADDYVIQHKLQQDNLGDNGIDLDLDLDLGDTLENTLEHTLDRMMLFIYDEL